MLQDMDTKYLRRINDFFSKLQDNKCSATRCIAGDSNSIVRQLSSCKIFHRFSALFMLMYQIFNPLRTIYLSDYWYLFFKLVTKFSACPLHLYACPL